MWNIQMLLLVLNTWETLCLTAVLARVDKYAEIEYSMVSSPTVSNTWIDFSLKVNIAFCFVDLCLFIKETDSQAHALFCLMQGEFYNIGKHREPPFSPTAFSLPPQNNNMLYIGMSAFTPNSAAFVYNTAGVLSLYITDDMASFTLQKLKI